MILQNKTAVIYGGAGAVGSAVAQAFAREGARVFLAGRTLSKLQAVAKDIVAGGGQAEAIEADAMDAKQVDDCIKTIIQRAGGIDISFNAISISDVQGDALTRMQLDDFAQPVLNAVKTHFITGTAAANIMRQQKGGVVLAITANVAIKPHPDTGGFGIACAAIESFCRQLAFEEGRYGIRVVCLRSAGSPDAPGVNEVFIKHAKNAGISREQFEAEFAEKTMLKRLPLLKEVANAAVLAASDHASAITAAVMNVSCGELAD
jgi:3-oxoacyl-[acyl-carrier protein] reductase